MNVSFLMEQERLKEIGIKAPFLMAYKNPALEKVNMGKELSACNTENFRI